MSYYRNHQQVGGRMQDQDQDQDQGSQLLFGPDVYSLIREDPLLAPIGLGSNHFAPLADATSDLPLNHDQQLRNHQQQQQQQQQHVVFNPEVPVQPETPQPFYYSEIQANRQPDQQQFTVSWNQIDGVRNGGDLVQQTSTQQQLEDDQRSIVVPDSSSIVHTPVYPPSLQSWPGRHGFTLELPTDNKDRNKWCFSELQKKLYVCSNVAVPIHIQLSDWNHNASVCITPVFKDSRCRMEPVLRCYNCKTNKAVSDPRLAEHLVQVEGDGCEYQLVNDRYIVSAPLYPPPPGEISTTFLMKLTCLTSCVGGPNRRLFCLVFTLRDKHTDKEIGRQVLDVKCCKCPSRDLNNEDRSVADQRARVNRVGEEHLSEVKQLASSLTVGQKRKRPNIKLEPGSGGRSESVLIPVEFVSKVKAYVNALAGEQWTRQNDAASLPFPEQE